MKHHIMFALGILLTAIFSLRGAIALTEPGFGVAEAYAAGGLILAGWLFMSARAEWRHARQNRPDQG